MERIRSHSDAGRVPGVPLRAVRLRNMPVGPAAQELLALRRVSDGDSAYTDL